MKDFTFHEAEPGGTTPFDFEPSLFHNPSQLALQSLNGWRWFYVVQSKHTRIAASLYLHVDKEVAKSSLRSPFGTVECSENIPAEVLFRFLTFVETRIRVLQVQKIIIKNPPLQYDLVKGALLQTFLFNLGYNVVDAEVGAVRFTSDEFSTGLNRLESRKLKKSDYTKLTYKFLPYDKLEEVYSFIHACRQRKGYSLSMTLDQLKHTTSRFTDKYVLLGVYLGDEMIAATLAVHVSSKVLYIFYADHSQAYDHLSPVVILVKGLYEYCQQQKIPMLDLGTSALKGEPNFGLLNFKMRLGATPTPKLTFEKILTS